MPGGETISSISIAWGRVATSTPVTVKLWLDPNGDGNPFDAVLLSSLASVTGTPNGLGPAVFTTYDIPDVTLLLVQSFFVGASLLTSLTDQPITIDEDPPFHPLRHRIAGGSDFAGSPNAPFPSTFDLFVHAHTPAAVAEPGSLALLGLALAALSVIRRRKQA